MCWERQGHSIVRVGGIRLPKTVAPGCQQGTNLPGIVNSQGAVHSCKQPDLRNGHTGCPFVPAHLVVFKGEVPKHPLYSTCNQNANQQPS